MMLRSASTPSLRSPVVSFPAAESPRKPPSRQLSCSNPAGFPKSLVNSPRSAAEAIDAADTESLRRARSAGNLEECFNAAFNSDEFPTLSRQSSRKLSRMPTLEVIPSYHPSDDEEEEEEEDGEAAAAAEGGFNSLNLAIHELTRELNGICDLGFRGEGKMYLAAGIGVNKTVGFLDESGYGGCGGGGGGSGPGEYGRDGGGGDNGGVSMEKNYKNMLLQSPNNPLFLRNYAHFLYQSKGDLVGAEEYYSRAILADPEDGEILCQYANLIWEMHHDKERTKYYYQRALQADSNDNKIIAAYAFFLWETEGDEDEDGEAANHSLGAPLLHHGIMASATA